MYPPVSLTQENFRVGIFIPATKQRPSLGNCAETLKTMVSRHRFSPRAPLMMPVFMFRIFVLQKQFGLFVEQTKFQIRDGFRFLRFLSLSLGRRGARR